MMVVNDEKEDVMSIIEEQKSEKSVLKKIPMWFKNLF
jgi:hypothetical protein